VIERLAKSAQALRLAGEQLGQVNIALQAEQARQRELNELKSRFVSMTSHEFRTPLSTILSSSDLLAAYSDRWTPEKNQEHFERIRYAVLSMTRMLDGILLIGRSDAGVLEFNPQDTDLVRVCAKSIEGASSLSKAKHEIIYDGPTSSEMVRADEALLRNIFDNLLSNAVKYSPTGGPVTLKLAREAEHVRIDISDQGIGIPTQDLDHLFDTFRRGSNVGTISGTGLCLAIVKRAVDLHGGTLSLSSEAGRGTTFTVRVPAGAHP
jgi:signal transduction histidine kinase